jgi:hypothetical protein
LLGRRISDGKHEAEQKSEDTTDEKSVGEIVEQETDHQSDNSP